MLVSAVCKVCGVAFTTNGPTADMNLASHDSNTFAKLVTTKYGNITIPYFKVFNRAFSLDEIKASYNKYARQVYLKEDFSGNGADEIVKLPNGFIPGTATVKIGELSTAVSGLPVGTKYMELTGNGTISRQISASELIDSGYVKSLQYYDGATWSNVGGDTLDAVVTANAWLSLANGILTFDLTSGKRIANIVLQYGELK